MPPSAKPRGAKKAKWAKLQPQKQPRTPKRGSVKQTLAQIDTYGPRPSKPAELFIVEGPGIYSVRKEQLVSLQAMNGLPQDVVKWERARSVEARRALVLNAGKPTERNPEAGACFHGHEFEPKVSDIFEAEWADPKPLTCTYGHSVYCSNADAIARYAGGRALSEGGAELFLNLFLNQGDHRYESVPAEGACRKAYEEQRVRVYNNLRSLFLLYPHDVEPFLARDGWPFRFGDPAAADANAPGLLGTPSLLACLATIVSDKSEGAPGASYQASIAGYHDHCRLHALSPKHVFKIKELVQHFALERFFKPLMEHDAGHSMSKLETYRSKMIRQIGMPPGGDMDAQWLERRSEMLFAKTWVQHCDMAHPDGEVDGADNPVLVPLLPGCAEERNGAPWLHLDREQSGSMHYRQVKAALTRMCGREPKAWENPKASDAEVIRALRAELKAVRMRVCQLEGEQPDTSESGSG
jgi:hypothetical protein